MAETANPTALLCTHCGASTGNQPIVSNGNTFCCDGCRTVYEILNTNGLCEYYELNPKSGVSRSVNTDSSWNLDELNLMVSGFTLFDSPEKRVILFHIPSMHCSSCIWLLERLGELDKGVVESRTDFVKKQLKITYDPRATTFGNLVILLRSLGYEPSLMPEDDGLAAKKQSRKLLIRLGVAGFCAGNIMMFSFPQYLGLDAIQEKEYGRMFDFINVALSVPLVFFAAAPYFRALWSWVLHHSISVKVPLAIGIGTLWLRSIYETATNTGTGYFDSLAGLIFFLLIGTWLQDRTFDALRFGEKAKHFFPMVARTLVNGVVVPKKVVDLQPADRVVLSHGEVIPADGILMGTDAFVDYSFATGESVPVHKVAGEVLLGGGKNAGGKFEMEVIRAFDNGRLAEIWKSNGAEEHRGARVLSFEARISRWFIMTTLVVAIAALIFWLPQNQARAWFALTAVLMVACPCALALAPPFAYNIVANYLASKGLFLRRPEIAGVLGEADAIVFDKTGTLTETEGVSADIPASYTAEELEMLAGIAAHSNHPYSEAVAVSLKHTAHAEVSNFREYPGKGSLAECGDMVLKLGSNEWVTGKKLTGTVADKRVFFSIDNKILEPVKVSNHYHQQLKQTLSKLNKQGMEMVVASGDSVAESSRLKEAAGNQFSAMYFEQGPAEKVAIVNGLKRNRTVVMIGDGLNDAAALQAGDVGMVVAAGTNNFTPEADAILLRHGFDKLPDYLALARKANRVVKETFVVSLTYNVIALGFAFAGRMSPLFAAIIMPASSIALMVYAWGRTKYLVKMEEKK